MSTSSVAINCEYPHSDHETGAPIIMPSRPDQSKSPVVEPKQKLKQQQLQQQTLQQQHQQQQQKPTNVVKLVKNAHGGIQIDHNIQRVRRPLV